MNKEKKALIIAALVAGLVFGFNDKRQVFEFSFWFLNFLLLSLASLIALLIHISVQKYFSKKYGAKTTYNLWATKRFWFTKSSKLKKPFPTGIILPILITILSTGQILFSASLSFITKIVPAYRIGRKYTQLTEYEIAKISLSGPLANILFAIILSIINKSVFYPLILVNSFIAISYMIPLPGLAGSKIFFGSKNLYILGFAFILATIFLLKFLNPLSTILLALLAAIIALIVFYYYKEIK